MKAKEAIEYFDTLPGDTPYQKLSITFAKEVDARVKLRCHNKPPSQGALDGVVREVAEWARKVGHGVGMPDKEIEMAIKSERGIAFAGRKMTEPAAEKQITRMRAAYQHGRHPIEALTPEGLDAIGDMIMGKVISEARKWGEGKGKLHPDRNLCPFGAEARNCPHQESLYDTRKGPLPTSVDDIEFYCNGDPLKDCEDR